MYGSFGGRDTIEREPVSFLHHSLTFSPDPDQVARMNGPTDGRQLGF